MISKILCVGNRIELSRSQNLEMENETNKKSKVYVSQILEILDDEKMKIGMPIEKGKVIPLPVNARLNACFYTEKGLYQGRILITDRYKEGTIYVLIAEVVSSLQKFQRRQYFRLGCMIDVKYRKITEGEVEEYIKEGSFEIEDEELYNEGTALDISGGGVRFVSAEKIPKNQEIFMSLEVAYDNQVRSYGLLGIVIQSAEAKSTTGMYEHRVEFTNVKGSVRESLIKYIFEEERQQRQKKLT